jgi:hypothetical protein
MRDFQKVPNSITRHAIPSGLFSGKSKQMYDYLYSLTRGAIVPKRSVRVTREQLMKGSGIGAKVTLEQNVARLKRAGLVTVKVIGGLAGGNEYTVLLPEEVDSLATLPSPPSIPSNGENVETLAPLESREPSQGLNIVNLDTSGDPKTLLKTNTPIDDEISPLRTLERELTGKNSASPKQWAELFDVLAAECRIAAGRTTVSSVPAFLAEHLRRRLWKLDKKQAQAEGRELPDQAPAAAQNSPVDCPDCKGTGWHYPEGVERGVAKCKHANLPKTK